MGKTKRDKGTKPTVVAEGSGLPVSVHPVSGSLHEITLVEETLAAGFVPSEPERLVRDRAKLYEIPSAA